MAVIDAKAKKTNSDTQESTRSGDAKNGRVVDIFTEKGLYTGVKHKLNKEDDAFTFSAPPEKGRYQIKVLPAKDFVSLKHVDPDDENSDQYYSLAMECPVLDAAGTSLGAMVFPTVTTRIQRGKDISTAAGLVVKLGYKIPEEDDEFGIAKLCAKVVKAEKTTWVELDWTGWSKELKKQVYNTMTDFPVGEDGKHEHIVQYRLPREKGGGTEEIKASLKVKYWYSKGEDAKEQPGSGAGSGTGSTGGSKKLTLNLVADDELSEETTKPTSAVDKVIADKAAKKEKEPPPEPEMEELLEAE